MNSALRKLAFAATAAVVLPFLLAPGARAQDEKKITLREAVTLAFMHKHMYEYMRDTSRRLDQLIAELKAVGEAGMLPQE